MDLDCLGPEARREVQEIIGYLNFSSGASDPRFLENLNRLFGRIEQSPADCPAWRRVEETLRRATAELRQSSDTFRQTDQAEQVLALAFGQLLPAYREFHRDLLFHQTEETLFRPFFLGRALEAVLAEGPAWNETERLISHALKRLNDFIGHRPVAVLETRQNLRPYDHEWVRPIPLYIAGAGVAVGRCHDILERAFRILRETDPELLRQTWFDPAMVDELAVDPRAFDFDHPNNRRLNYHFGCWDPHLIDNRGYYRRFVIQQVTLDAMLSRVEESPDAPYEDVLFEAAAVLAGTILMGSGVSGSGPDAHDSSTTMATLLPHIAGYRDAFYEQLLARLPGDHGQRLRTEAQQLQQPFGGARQHLNQKLARCRAEQLQHVHLALLFARMGYTEAAARQAQKVPVASARMRSDIDCRLSLAHQAIDHGELAAAAAHLPTIEDILQRAIHCGALVDPWNILGFGGQYSLFPALENSIPDHRVDEILDLMSDLFDLYARLEKEAAAAGAGPLQAQLSARLDVLAQWWDQFASTEVSGIEGVSGHEAWQSAEDVAAALAAWHTAGPAAGDVAFWRRHVEEFTSPKAFALLTEALLERDDTVAAMSLLVAWLSRADEIPLTEGDYTFHGLVLQWMEDLWTPQEAADGAELSRDERWQRTRKFLDYLEANADEYWRVPQLELGADAGVLPADEFLDEDDNEEGEDDEEHELFGAAYENVIYRDSTDDGFESDMLDGVEPASDFELAGEAERISDRLQFLAMLARVWQLPAAASLGRALTDDLRAAMHAWLAQATENQRGLLDLLAAVQRYRIPAPRSSHDAMLEYARRLGIREILLERIIAACVDTADARRFLLAATGGAEPAGAEPDAPPAEQGATAVREAAWEAAGQAALDAVYRGDVAAVRDAWPKLLAALAPQPLCYIPVARGGNPQRIVTCRSLHRLLRRLLEYTPRLGLLTETVRLIGAIEEMERTHPVGPGALTEFDRLFEIGAHGVFQCVVASSAKWPKAQRQPEALVETLGQTVKPLLERWLAYTANVRISVLETVNDEIRWEALKGFIQRYGADLFTQRFMNPGNLRAILYQGADAYLESLAEEPDGEHFRLLDELDRAIPRADAVRWLELAVAAVAENYTEYVDYNTTTTQSDRGEMLYTLLDFLRLRATYDRMAWGLQPLVVAHKVLVREGRDDAAALLRREVATHNGPVAERHLQRYQLLARRYGMRLPSIADRLGERFVRPLAIDRLCALVRPAVEELRDDLPPRVFEELETEVAAFTREPSGAGFDVPGWLEALEDEVQRVRDGEGDDEPSQFFPHIAQVKLSRAAIQRQITSWETDTGR